MPDGFASEPGDLFNPAARWLDEIWTSERCAVLLGQPGTGKSTEFRRAEREAGWLSGAKVLIRAGHEPDLRAALEQHPILSAWRQDSGEGGDAATEAEHLVILIDGLDEVANPSRSPVTDAVSVIASVVRRLPLHRVSLFVSCRTASWSSEAEKILRSLATEMASPSFPVSLEVWELGPLRASDVEQAIRVRAETRGRRALTGAESQQFIADLRAQELGVLASRPLTASFLLDAWDEDGVLPTTRRELFERGCQALCRNMDRSRMRRAGVVEESLDPERRLAVAMRLAALSVLGGRPRIVLGPVRASDAEVDDQVVTVASILDHELLEPAGPEKSFAVEASMIHEVVATSLFEEHPDGYHWFHREIAEFLASRYLLGHDFAEHQIMGFLAYGYEHEGLVPQMEGVIRWIDDEFPKTLRRALIERDPQLALSGDLASRSDGDKELVVRALLEGHGADRLYQREGEWHRYSKLAFTGLADLLQPLLGDADGPEPRRLVAIEMAGPCKVLGDDLAALALDPDNELSTRERAAYALLKHADHAPSRDARRRLLALLEQPAGCDPNKDLQGATLLVAWQDGLLDLPSLFHHLDAASTPGYIGAYAFFLTTLFAELHQRHGVDGVRAALDWAVRRDPAARGSGYVKKAWKLAIERLQEDPSGLAPVLAGIVRTRVRHHGNAELFRDGLDKRGARLILERILDEPAEDSRPRLAYRDDLLVRQRFLRGDDLRWLLDWFGEEPDGERRLRIARLIDGLAWYRPELQSLIIERYHQDPARHEPLRHRVMSDLDDPEVQVRRERSIDERRRELLATTRAAEFVPEDYTAAHVEHWLSKALDPQLDHERKTTRRPQSDPWIRLLDALCLTHPARARYMFLDHVIARREGWSTASEDTRERILQAGERYLRLIDPGAGQRLGTDERRLVLGAGLHGLILIADVEPSRLGNIGMSALARWAPVVLELDLPRFEPAVNRQFVAREMMREPAVRQAIIDAVDTLLRAPEEYRIDVSRWHAWWHPELVSLFAEFLPRAGLTERAVNVAIYFLEHAPGEARPAIARLLESGDGSPPGEPSDTRDIQARLAREAMVRDPAFFAELVKRLMLADSALGQAIVTGLEQHIAFRDRGAEFLHSLEPAFLGWLYCYSRDRERRAPDNPGDSSGLVFRLRDHVANSLVKRERADDAWSAVAELRTLSARYADDDSLRSRLYQAERNAREATWIRPTPRVILALAGNRDRWWILHSVQLQGAIRQELARLSRSRREYWERVAGGEHRPVSRARIDAITHQHLGTALEDVVVGCAVDVRRDARPGTIRVEAGRDPGGMANVVHVAILTSWDEDPVERLALEVDNFVLPSGDMDEPDNSETRWLLVALAWFAGNAWTRSEDRDRRRRALMRPRAQVETILASHARSLQARHESDGHRVRLDVTAIDLTFDEAVQDMASVPWAPSWRERLDAEGVTIIGARSVGDAEHWVVQVAWPTAICDRFGVAPQALMVLSSGSVPASLMMHAQDSLVSNLDADRELDPYLLVVCSDQQDVDVHLSRIPGRRGQWVTWRAPEFESLEGVLARELRRFDIFDDADPARGRYFFGREEQEAEITRRTLEGKWTGIYGLRKSGKTSLARAVTDALDPLSAALASPLAASASDIQPRMTVVWWDVQGSSNRSDEASVWRDLLERLRERANADGFSIDRANPDVADDVFNATGRALRGYLRGSFAVSSPGALAREPRSLCIVLDEYDLLFDASRDPAPAPMLRLLDLLRGLAQETGRLSVIFIGRDDEPFGRSELDGAPNPMLGWVRDEWVGPLSAAARDELLESLGKRVGLRFGPETRALAEKWTGGFPGLLKHLGSAVLETARDGSRSGVEIDTDSLDRDTIIDRYLDRGAVRGIIGGTFQLLEQRYPRAHELLTDLISRGPDSPASALKRHGGWRGDPARTLRHFGLMTGSSGAPRLLGWVRWYGEEMLGLVDGLPDETSGE